LNKEEQMSRHVPVMLNEVIMYLQLLPRMVIVDCTLGEGGHSEAILRKITPGGQLIGIDQDDDALSLARLHLSRFDGAFKLFCGNFQNIKSIVFDTGTDSVDGILFDLGVSSLQLSNANRGFSFTENGRLDMRMDKNAKIDAFDLVNNLSEEELANLIYNFGEERHSRRIAHRIAEQRAHSPILNTQQLSKIVVQALPRYRMHRRIHPATKTFMALRIAVNRELEVLEKGITDALGLLKPGGRICVIAFHSLEDRIIKNIFKSQAKEMKLKILTKKPLVPLQAEIEHNYKSRSAKLRVAEKQ